MEKKNSVNNNVAEIVQVQHVLLYGGINDVII